MLHRASKEELWHAVNKHTSGCNEIKFIYARPSEQIFLSFWPDGKLHLSITLHEWKSILSTHDNEMSTASFQRSCCHELSFCIYVRPNCQLKTSCVQKFVWYRQFNLIGLPSSRYTNANMQAFKLYLVRTRGTSTDTHMAIICFIWSAFLCIQMKRSFNQKTREMKNDTAQPEH